MKHLAYNGIFYKDGRGDEALERVEKSAFDIQIKKLDNKHKQYAITKKRGIAYETKSIPRRSV